MLFYHQIIVGVFAEIAVRKKAQSVSLQDSSSLLFVLPLMRPEPLSLKDFSSDKFLEEVRAEVT